MNFKFSLQSFVLLTFVFSTLLDNTYASVQICFTKNSKTDNRTFDTKKVTYEEARETLQLSTKDIFKHNGRVIERSEEAALLANTTECNEIITENGESSIEVCISDDRCEKIILKNSAKINTLRDKLIDSLPKYYGNENCANIYFVTKEDREIQRSEEVNIPYQNIVKNGGIKAYNKFIYNRTQLDITWLLSSYRVRVNMLTPLSSLRYWITKPSACPNLKDKLNLPNKPLFPNPSDDSAQNWLARDRYAELNKVPSAHLVNSQLVAPYNREKLLPIEFYSYKIESSQIRRLYYVDVAETEKPAFTGSRTDVFRGNYLTVKVSSRSPKDKILLPMKDVRSTNNLAVPWTNVIIATNNTSVNIMVKWDNHQPGYAYECGLFDFRAGYQKHDLFTSVSENGICNFDYYEDPNTEIHHDLIFKKEQLIEKGEDLSKFRYEVGVSMIPHRPGHYTCHPIQKRETKATGNIDINRDHITMGGAGQGESTNHRFAEICKLRDKDAAENKRSLHFNVFIFRSQEIAEKIIEDIPTF